MEFLLIAVIVLFVLEYTKRIDSKKFISDVEPYFSFLMEDDYKFLLSIKYGGDEDLSRKLSLHPAKPMANAAMAVYFAIFFMVQS